MLWPGKDKAPRPPNALSTLLHTSRASALAMPSAQNTFPRTPAGVGEPLLRNMYTSVICFCVSQLRECHQNLTVSYESPGLQHLAGVGTERVFTEQTKRELFHWESPQGSQPGPYLPSLACPDKEKCVVGPSECLCILDLI